MRTPRCTIDSSCLVALEHLDLIPQLSWVFDIVLVPRAVREELFRRPETEERLKRLFANFTFFQPCDEYEAGAVEFMLSERQREGTRDRGEAEAVIQAVQCGAMVIVDDKWGRELARTNRLETHGTIWVLQTFHELGLVTGEEVHGHFVRLKARGLYQPWKLIDEFLVRIGQRPLPGQ